MITKDIRDITFQKLRDDIDLSMYTIQGFYSNRSLPNDPTHPHRLRFNAMIYISEGKGEHFIDYKKYKLKPGTVLFVSKYQIHHFKFHPSLRGYIVPFNDEIIYFGQDDSLRDMMSSALASINSLQKSNKELLVYLDSLWEEYNNTNQPFSGEVARTLLRTILLKSLIRGYQSMIGQQDRVYKSTAFFQLKSLIEENYHRLRNVNGYAEKLGKSCKQLNKIAQDNTGQSVKELVDDRVLLELKRLLAFSQQSITEIALNLGFNEATNMTKFFRRHTQLTPKEFREVCRKNQVGKVAY